MSTLAEEHEKRRKRQNAATVRDALDASDVPFNVLEDTRRTVRQVKMTIGRRMGDRKIKTSGERAVREAMDQLTAALEKADKQHHNFHNSYVL